LGPLHSAVQLQLTRTRTRRRLKRVSDHRRLTLSHRHTVVLHLILLSVSWQPLPNFSTLLTLTRTGSSSALLAQSRSRGITRPLGIPGSRLMSIYTSVSGDPTCRDDVIRMASFLETQLKQYGVETQTVELGTHVMEGQSLKLPPLVLGKIGDDESKKTILIYGHFDVQPVCRHLPQPHKYISPTILTRHTCLMAGASHHSS
jgi:hypothetical protein